MSDIVQTDPLSVMSREFGSLRHVLDRLLADPLFQSREADAALLDVDVIERDGKIEVVASLPGFAKDEIDVQLREGMLTVKGEHREEKETTEGRYIRRERRYGSISRSVSVPGVAGDAPVDAELKDGILTVKIDTPARPQPKHIEIRSA